MRYYEWKKPFANLNKGLSIREIKARFEGKEVYPNDILELARSIEALKSEKDYLILADEEFKFIDNELSKLGHDGKRPIDVLDFSKIGEKRTIKDGISIGSELYNKLKKGHKTTAYFGWMGFDRRMRVIPYLALVEGFELRSFFNRNIDLQKLEHYGKTAKIMIPSRQKKKKFHKVIFKQLPTFDLMKPTADHLADVGKITSHCGCDKNFYEGDLHRPYKRDYVFFCQHHVAGMHRIYEELKDNKKYNLAIDIFPIPTLDCIDFVDKCRDQVLYYKVDPKTKKKRLSKLPKKYINRLLAARSSNMGFKKSFRFPHGTKKRHTYSKNLEKAVNIIKE